MDKKLDQLEKILAKGRIKQNEPLSLHTSFKIGGPGQFYVEVEKIEELVDLINEARKLEIPYFVLGGGSNIVVSDSGIKGLVIKNNCRRFEMMGMTGRVKNQKISMDKAMVFAESGVVVSQLVRFAIEQGLSGLEYQLGLPGTIGGAIFMNSNFPRMGQYVGDCVYKATLLGRDGQIKEVDKSYFNFAYDKSILQETGEILLSVIFKLEPMEKKILWERGNEALKYRMDTQPKGVSAGCTFRNISIVDAIRVPTPAQVTSAGYLIDKAGLKGKRVGDAMISEKHANFILNMGKATADDVAKLIKLIKDEVYKKFNVHLVLEVKTVGFN